MERDNQTIFKKVLVKDQNEEIEADKMQVDYTGVRRWNKFISLRAALAYFNRLAMKSAGRRLQRSGFGKVSMYTSTSCGRDGKYWL